MIILVFFFFFTLHDQIGPSENLSKATLFFCVTLLAFNVEDEEDGVDHCCNIGAWNRASQLGPPRPYLEDVSGWYLRAGRGRMSLVGPVNQWTGSYEAQLV